MSYKVIITVFALSICLNSIAQKTKKHKTYFKADNQKLTGNEKSNLISFIEEYKSKIKHISFIGYCDDNANSEYNLLLSKKRAIEVKEFTYELLNKQIPYSLQYKGELGLKEFEGIENQRKENRRVEITCILINTPETKSKSSKKVITEKSTNNSKTKGMNYHDFLNHVADSEPGIKRERMKFTNKQKYLDSISKIVTEEEIKDFEQEFFNTKVGKPMPTELFYYLVRDKHSKYNRKMLLKLESRKKLKLLSIIMQRNPKLKVKLYTYAYKEMTFKRIKHNKEAKMYDENRLSEKILLAMKYLTKEGISKNRLFQEKELVKKFKLNASHIDRSPEVTEIIRLN